MWIHLLTLGLISGASSNATPPKPPEQNSGGYEWIGRTQSKEERRKERIKLGIEKAVKAKKKKEEPLDIKWLAQGVERFEIKLDIPQAVALQDNARLLEAALLVRQLEAEARQREYDADVAFMLEHGNAEALEALNSLLTSGVFEAVAQSVKKPEKVVKPDPEPKPDTKKIKNQAMQETLIALQGILQTLNKPRTVVRDNNGRITALV